MTAARNARLNQLATNCLAVLMESGADGETMAVVCAMAIQRIALHHNSVEIMTTAGAALMEAAEVMATESLN